MTKAQAELRKIIALTEESRLWLDLGGEKMALFKSDHPPRQLTFTQIASLTEIGMTLRRSAVGMAW